MGRVSVWEDEKVLEIGGDGCAIMWMYLMPMKCTPKMTKIVNFVIYILPLWKQKQKNSVSIIHIKRISLPYRSHKRTKPFFFPPTIPTLQIEANWQRNREEFINQN